MGVLVLSGILAAFVVGLIGAPAAGAPTCELNGRTLTVRVGPQELEFDDATVGLAPGDPIHIVVTFGLGGPEIDCANGPATVENTDIVEFRGSDDGAPQHVAIDAGSWIGSGATYPAFLVDLGDGTDAFTLYGSRDYGEHYVLGADGINLDPDAGSSVDVTFLAPVDWVIVNLAAGDDVASAAGGAGTGGPFPVRTTMQGALGDDRLVGGDGPDQLLGQEGNDTILGGAGEDYLEGGLGDDTLAGGVGSDTVVGDDGTDTASYARSPTAVSVVVNGAASGGDAEGDTLIGIENLTGSRFGDSIRGDAGANVLRGGAGADLLKGRGGPDRLVGGAGPDRLLGGSGDDVLSGGPARDDIVGGRGTDECSGGPGPDSIVGCEA